MKRTLLLFQLVVCLPILVNAQNKEQYQQTQSTLLWRITGPGSKAPSYLFGTMHLQDKRLFYFTDSLYAALQSVDGFAGELDMNDMNELLASWVKNEEVKSERTSFLNEHISADQKKKYKSALEKKFKKSIDKIRLHELEAAANNWNESFRKEDDMPTFVDAFLYGIAKREGKWIGALEKIEDQLDFKRMDLESTIKSALLSDAEKKKMMEQFVSIYLSEDLSRMYEIVTNAGGNYGSWKMNHRNLNMVAKIDSLAKHRSCFYAVGAAHLSGDSGMIQLLLNNGYKAEPVLSKKRISPNEYLVHQPAVNWQEINWSNGDFLIKMPGNASKMEGMGGFQDARMYFDPLSMSGFMSGYIPMENRSDAEIDSTCQLMPSFYAKDGKLFRDSVWLLNGKKAYEIEASTKDGFVNMVVHPVTGGIVMNMIFSMSQSGLKMHNAADFFTSFVNKKKPLPPPLTGWRRKINALKQYSFEAPVDLKLTPKPADSSWNNETYSGTDPETQTFYSITAMETKKGLYSSLDSLYFDELLTQQKASKTHRLLKSEFINLDGYPGVSMLLGTKVEKDSIYVRFNVINRGNRRYSILAAYYPKGQQKTEVDRFINGIRFIPYVATKTIEGHPAYENFTVQSPGLFTIDTSADLSGGSSRFVQFDSTSAVTVFVQRDPIDKYYHSASDSSFYKEQLGHFKTEEDSIIRYELKMENGQLSADALIDLDGTHNLKRVKLITSGDTIYSIAAVMSPEVGNTVSYKKMFDSFRLLTVNPNHYTKSKARQLFNDLLLPDSLLFNEAKEALEWVYIDKNDLPYLHEALLNPMIDFNERTNCTHDELLKRVLSLSDSTTISFIRKSYPGLKERNTVLQYPLLSVLARMYTKESYAVIQELLESGLPTIGNPGILYGAMQDSLELSKSLFPLLVKFKNDSLLRKIIPGVLIDLKKANLITEQEIENLKPDLLSLSDEYLVEQRIANIQLPICFDAMLELLIRFDEEDSRQRLDSFALHSNEDVQYATFIALLEHKKLPPAKSIQSLAADPYYRSRIWEEMSIAGFSKFFPASLRNQQAIAESHLFREIWQEFGGFDLQFLKEVTKKIDGKKHRLFLYKVSFKTEDGQEEYLGVAGPYSGKSKIDATPGDYNGVFYDEVFDASRVKEQLDAFIQSQQ